MSTARYLIEASAIRAMLALLGALPLDMASGIGGWLGRRIGPLLVARNRLAHANLRAALPGKSEFEYRQIVESMWDNLGRVMAEYPHIDEIVRDRIQFENKGILSAATSIGRPVILVGAHMANWELSPHLISARFGVGFDVTYRPLNNPYADRILYNCRTANGRIRAHPKSSAGGKQMVKALREKRCLGILIDQKHNEGIAVPFFGREALTNPSFVMLGQKFGAPVVPGHIVRLQGAHFRFRLCQPLRLQEGNEPLAAEAVLGEAHAYLEEWIRENPGQWIWLHSRWREPEMSSDQHQGN